MKYSKNTSKQATSREKYANAAQLVYTGQITSGEISTYVDNLNAFLRFPSIDRKTEVRAKKVASLGRKLITGKKNMESISARGKEQQSRSKPIGARSRRKE